MTREQVACDKSLILCLSGINSTGNLWSVISPGSIFSSIYLVHAIVKALSDECRIGQRLRNACQFLASVWYPSKMSFMPVWSYDWKLVIKVICVVCACYFSPLSKSFVFNVLNVIHFSCVGLCGTLVTGHLVIYTYFRTTLLYEILHLFLAHIESKYCTY